MQLRQTLPELLTQEYPADYEVIVVDMHSTDDTKDILEELEYTHPHLHHTHCPSTARDISLHRLALTLGIRAAAHEWVVLSEADCRPSGPQWLLHLMQPCTDDKDAVLGVMRYDDERGWAARRRQFFHLWQQMRWLPEAMHSAPYRADEACLCYRRSHFMEHQGFAASANLEAGAATLLVNRHVKRGRCDVSLYPQAFVRQEQPPTRRWRQDRLFFMETRHHFRRTFFYRLRYFRHVSLTWFFTFATAGAILVEVLLQHYILLALVALLWVAHYCQRHHHLRQALQATLTPKLSSLTIALSPILLHLVAIWDAQAWLRWNFSKKQTFEKKPL
jgi:cellulose synthase/poly-beta-1,6-N-acetylglucosamine synthase-like glycosyltransferase